MVEAKKAVEDVGCVGHDGWDRERMGKKPVVLVGVLLAEGFLKVIGQVGSLGCPGYTARCSLETPCSQDEVEIGYGSNRAETEFASK